MGLSGVRSSIPVLWLGMAALALVVEPCGARGQDKVTLRWKFQKGDQLRCRADTDGTNTIKVPVPGQTPADVKSTHSMTVESAWSVEDVTEDGSARIATAFERIRIAVKAPGGELSEDTKAGSQEGFERSKALLDVIGGTVIFRMTPQGEVADYKLSERLAKAIEGAADCGLAEESLRAHIQQIALVMPREPVEAGRQWDRRVDKPTPGLSQETQNFIYTYKGTSDRRRGSQAIDVKTRLDIKADPKGVYRMELKYKSQDGRGTIDFNDATGHLAGMEFTQKAELEMTMLGKGSASVREDHIKVSSIPNAGP